MGCPFLSFLFINLPGLFWAVTGLTRAGEEFYEFKSLMGGCFLNRELSGRDFCTIGLKGSASSVRAKLAKELSLGTGSFSLETCCNIDRSGEFLLFTNCRGSLGLTRNRCKARGESGSFIGKNLGGAMNLDFSYFA
jgi:hypothetical protein